VSDPIRVHFLGEERVFQLEPDGVGDTYACEIVGDPADCFVLYQTGNGTWNAGGIGAWIGYGATPQAAVTDLEQKLEPLAKLLVTISGGRLRKRDPWAMLEQVSAALEPITGTAQDVDHVLECHAEQLPDYFRAVCKAVEKAHAVVCLSEEEMDELERIGGG
jgi:hypothetical protein